MQYHEIKIFKNNPHNYWDFGVEKQYIFLSDYNLIYLNLLFGYNIDCAILHSSLRIDYNI